MIQEILSEKKSDLWNNFTARVKGKKVGKGKGHRSQSQIFLLPFFQPKGNR